MPALYEKPSVKTEGTSVTIRWNAWNETIDYGTGSAEKYRLYSAKKNQSFVPVEILYGTEMKIDNLEKGTEYVFAVSVFRVINSNSTEGALSPKESVRIKCDGE